MILLYPQVQATILPKHKLIYFQIAFCFSLAIAEIVLCVKKSQTIISLDFSNYEADKKNKFGMKAAEAIQEFCSNNIFFQYLKLSNLLLDDKVATVVLKSLLRCPNILGLDLSNNDLGMDTILGASNN